MNSHLLLFTFDLLSLTFTPQFDPLNHILLDQPAPGTFRVIKNGQNLRNLFHLFEKMQFTLVCYSAKNYVQIMNILSKVNENLRWIYIHVDKQKLPFLRPNRAHLCDIDDKVRIIEYGQGFSSSEPKEQIRIAICSAIKVGFEESKEAFILFENNTQQISKLKQNGYHHIFSSIPENETALSSLISEIQKIIHTKQKKPKTQFDQFTQNCNELDFKFAHQISSFFYLERKKNIAPPVSLGLSKQSSLIFRQPKSMSISPQVFRWSGDKQIYLGRAQVTSKIGGEIEYQIQENKILQSCLYQTLSQIYSQNDVQNLFLTKYLCLPMQLSQFTMRHSLIKAYNKNKAYFIVQPYLKKLTSVAESFSPNNKAQQALLLMKSAQFNGRKVKGLGNLLAVSLLCGQKFRQKLFLETVGFIQIKLANSQLIHCCRTNICQNFIKQPIKVTQFFEIQLVRNTNVRIKIEQLHESIIQQIKQTIQLFCQSYPIILAILKSQIWRFDKSDQIKIIENNMNTLKTQKGDKLTMIQVDIRYKMKINRINAKLLKYLIGASPDQRFQYFSEQTPVQKVSKFGFGLDPENVYVQRMKASDNFIIFGQCVPVVSLMKWIKSMNNNIQIVYLSLLIDKPQAYIKQVKLAKSQRKSIMFVIDHCEIEEAGGQLEEGKSITDSNWGMKTIFIYRLKHGSQKKLAYLTDGLTSGDSIYSVVHNKLLKSYEQTFKTIFEVIEKQELNSNEFEVYAAAIKLYIDRKFYQFGKSIGLTDVSQLFEKLRTLVRFISCKINRIVTIVKDKEFNFFNSASQDSQGTLNSSEQNDLTRSRSVQSQNNAGLQHLQSVSKAQLLLYCLPIHISNQRVWLIHDIHQFLSAYYLHEQIMNEKWQGNLEGQQAKSFLLWFPRMKNKKAIEKNLIKMIDRFAKEEQNKSNKTQIMGGNNKLNDCLQMLKKIGSQFIFCRLQNMFYFDSNVLDMIPVGSGEFIVVTQQKKIFRISKTQNFQDKKECWNMMEVVQAKINLGPEKYSYAGSDCKTNKGQQQMNVHFVVVADNSKYIKIDKNSIKKRSLRKAKNEVKQKEDKIFIDNIPLLLENQIVSCNIVYSMFAVLITASGELVVSQIVQDALTKENQMILSKKSSIFKISQAGCLMIQGDKAKCQIIVNSDAKIKVINKLKSNGNIEVVVIINNVIVNTIKENEKEQNKFVNKESAVLLISFAIQISPNQHFEVQNMSKTILLTPFGTIDIGVNYLTEQGSQDRSFVRAQAFENITNALLVWDLQVAKQQEQIYIVEKPNMKFYRIQNDPAGIYYFANYLFVASKFNFLKRMSLPKSQQEFCI